MRDSMVCAVVVTYNRKNLLLECLEAIRRQTRPVDAIYIIDNASTDGTPEVLKENGYILELPPFNLSEPYEIEHKISNLVDGNPINVFYVRMHENTGSAGGFYEGMKRAYEKGYDWFWLMDDDVEPKPNALEVMLTYKNISLFIHPRKIYGDGTLFYWEYLFPYAFPFVKNLNDISFCKYGKKWISVNYGCFEGALINRLIVEKIGFPDKKYFIIYDDTFYGFKASLYTNVIYIQDILFIKKIKREYKNKTLMFIIKYTDENSRITSYYMIRNFFLLYKDINTLIPGYFLCSLFWINTLKIFTRKVIKHLLTGKLYLLSASIKGFIDGVKYLLNDSKTESKSKG
jgi:GT2 family glycosyltransferase